MEDLKPIFSSHDSVGVLKQRIATMTNELQLAKIQKEEEMRKRRESVEEMKQLLQLLQVVYKERDEARDQLQKLLRNSNSAGAGLSFPIPSPGRTSSSVTESSSFSDTVDYHSQGDSLYAIISGTVPPAEKMDRGTQIINNLAKRKTLPVKGKLLDAVLEAGPLLQSAMLVAPLPRWRNSPPLQPIQAAPVGGPPSLKRPFNNLVSGFGSSEFLKSSVLNIDAEVFSNAGGVLYPAGIGINQMIPPAKTQRTQ